MKDFLFKPEQAQTPVGALSGGERNRLMLALELSKPSNLLVLDEPTNDLDMDTIDLLQEVLDEYQGTALIVSHDRDFLDRVATSVIYMSGDGTAFEYAGSCSELQQKLKEDRLRKSPDSSKTSKVKQPLPAAKAPQAKKQAKLSYKQQRALDVLPQEIEALEQQISAIEKELSDSSLYGKNPERFDELTQMLAQSQNLKANKENEWLEVELLKDELENR